MLLLAAHYVHDLGGPNTPVSFTDQDSFGLEVLLYSRAEFDQLVEAFSTWYRSFCCRNDCAPFTGPDDLSTLYEATGGHAGTTYLILSRIAAYRRDTWDAANLRDLLRSDELTGLVASSRAMKSVHELVCARTDLRFCLEQGLIAEELVAIQPINVVQTIVRIGAMALRAPAHSPGSLYPSWPSPLIRRAWCLLLHRTLPPPDGPFDYMVDLNGFVRRCLQGISSKSLRESYSTGASPSVLYERQWQMSFYYAAASMVPSDISISPDIGPSFGSAGYLDFYVNSQKQWGIELLRCGSDVAKHVNRFGQCGIYKEIPLSQYAIIDFRPAPAAIRDIDLQLIERGLWVIEYSSDYSVFRTFSKEADPTQYSFAP